jgi:hypothetical protein
LLAAIHPAGLHPPDDRNRIDGRGGGHLYRQFLRPVVGDAAHAVSTGEHRRPGGRDIPAERRGRAEPSDDDAALIFAAH